MRSISGDTGGIFGVEQATRPTVNVDQLIVEQSRCITDQRVQRIAKPVE